jgi:hypothetical protein
MNLTNKGSSTKKDKKKEIRMLKRKLSQRKKKRRRRRINLPKLKQNQKPNLNLNPRRLSRMIRKKPWL